MKEKLPKHATRIGLTVLFAIGILSQCEESKQEPIPTATAHAIESDREAVEGILAIVITQEAK